MSIGVAMHMIMGVLMMSNPMLIDLKDEPKKSK
jgi:hypothetical protein